VTKKAVTKKADPQEVPPSFVAPPVDPLTPVERSRLMSRIRRKGTKPEVIVRSVLHRMGLRFRLHDRSLPGTPDIVLPRHGTVVFVHGCFWHRHGCASTTTPKTRTEFWLRKFSANQARDAITESEVEALGWRVVLVWECETRDLVELAQRLMRVFSETVDLDASRS